MKSQDLLLLLKLVSLERQEPEQKQWLSSQNAKIPDDWQGWAASQGHPIGGLTDDFPEDRYSVRSLEASTGISKSEISAALRRSHDVGLVRPDRKTGLLRVNTRAVHDLISSAIKYVFPAKPGALVKGIPTAAFAPVLAGRLMAPDVPPLVWEDKDGAIVGQGVAPIHKAATHAVRRDPDLYAMLALVDSIRLGGERESTLAKKLLAGYLGRTDG